MTADSGHLLDLLEEAREADPRERIDYRDRIAPFGRLAVREMRPWLGDPQLAAFAVRVIERAAAAGQDAEAAAVEALLAVRGSSFSAAVQSDAQDALRRLGPAAMDAKVKGRSPSPRSPQVLSELALGRLYRRIDLKEAGLLGNIYSGISYPATGVHACLFSGGGGGDAYGYRDMPSGERGYRYYGEWRGSRDMSLTGGNKAIVERSPNLYLFVGQGDGFHRFEGRYMVVSHDRVVAEREGTVGEAIVFVLERVSDLVIL